MKTKEILENLKILTSIPGPSGFEDEVIEKIKEMVGDCAHQVVKDNFGNLICKLEGKNPEAPGIVFGAHVDEIGCMVSCVEATGHLRVLPIGGKGFFDARVCPGSLVNVLTEKGYVKGVFGSKPPHVSAEEIAKGKPYTWDDLFVDIGAEDAEQVKEMGVGPGSGVAFEGWMCHLVGDRYVGHPFDNRVGCAVLIELIKELSKVGTDATIYFLWATQEEPSVPSPPRGARVAKSEVEAEIAFGIDTAPVADHPGAPIGTPPYRLGGGPILRLMDYWVLSSPKLTRFAIKTARENNIPVQYGPVGGYTDASELQYGPKGRFTLPLCYPIRYTHSPAEVIDMQDVDKLVRLCLILAKKIKSLEDIR